MLNQSVSFVGGGLGEYGCALTPQSNIPTCSCPEGYKMAQSVSGSTTSYWCQKIKETSDGWSFDWSDAVSGVKDILGITCLLFGKGCPQPAAGIPGNVPIGYAPPAWYETTGGMVAMGLGAVGVGALVYIATKRK